MATLSVMEREVVRSDAVENRRRMVEAVGRLLSAGEEITLTKVAVEAGISRATAYRNFTSTQEAIDAYIASFLQEFEEAAALAEGLDEVCVEWARLIEDRLPALIHVRSTKGFLERVRSNDPLITRVYRVMVDAFHAEYPTGIPFDVDYAIYLWNLLLDPRELLDLAAHTGLGLPDAAQRQTALFLAAVEALAADGLQD